MIEPSNLIANYGVVSSHPKPLDQALSAQGPRKALAELQDRSTASNAKEHTHVFQRRLEHNDY